MVNIQSELCNGCGICADVCPNYVLVRKDGSPSSKVIVTNSDLCCKCGHCVLHCPQNAIRHQAIAEEEISRCDNRNIDPADIEQLMMRRRSTRCFKTEAVPKDRIERLIEIATNAGTASNMQSEYFIVIQDQRLINQLEEMTIDILWNKGLKYATDRSIIGRLLAKRYAPELVANFKRYHDIIAQRKNAKQAEGIVFRKAPCLIVLCGLRQEHLSPINCALAIRNMELLAAADGLGTCWAGLFISASRMDCKKVNAFLQVDDTHQVFGALMAGYPKYHPERIVRRKPREVRWL
ncbi:putative Nitroreductase [Syntrophobacter sp. SbD1]|nr:putative Nitroreductase [Syntrophobacter sp. SbD1]